MSEEASIADFGEAISDDNVILPIDSKPEPSQKLFTQEEATKAVLKERARAYEKGRRDLTMEIENQKLAENQAVTTAPTAPPQETAVNTEDLKKLVETETARVLEDRTKQQQDAELQARINKIQAEVQAKLSAAAERLPSITANIQQLDERDTEAASVIMVLANDMENTADVIDSVFEDEELAERLMRYAEKGQFEKLKRAIVKINDSVSSKDEASHKSTAEPLLSVNPAKRAKIQSSGTPSVAELRMNPKFRM